MSTSPESPTTRQSAPLAPSTGILRPADDVEGVELGPNHVLFPVRGAETGGAYSLTDFLMAPPPAPGPPPHIHEDADEAVYVLEGELEMALGDQKLIGTAGAVMLAPRGTLHSIANRSAAPARFIVILSPPGYEGFWQEMAALRLRLGGAPDGETVLALQRKYHLVSADQARRFD
jgi:quercetin dioxygenase-like cupin family protein